MVQDIEAQHGIRSLWKNERRGLFIPDLLDRRNVAHCSGRLDSCDDRYHEVLCVISEQVHQLIAVKIEVRDGLPSANSQTCGKPHLASVLRDRFVLNV